MAEIKCTITIVGKEGDDTATATFQFDPPLKEENADAYEKSGVGYMATVLLNAVEQATDQKEHTVVTSDGSEIEW